MPLVSVVAQEILEKMILFPRSDIGPLQGFLSVNTRSRRLGVLLFLVNCISQGRKIEFQLLSPKEMEIEILKKNFRSQGFFSGELSSNKWSLQHYLNLGQGLNLFVRQGAIFDLTSEGMLLSTFLTKDFLAPYPLSTPIKMFFLFQILSLDFWSIRTLAHQIVANTTILKEFFSSFQNTLLTTLSEFSGNSKSSIEQRKSRDLILRIKNWRKPEKYSEHLVAAKINWLFDLGLISLSNKREKLIEVNEKQKGWFEKVASITIDSGKEFFELMEAYFDGFLQASAQKTSNTTIDYFENALEKLFSSFNRSEGFQKIRTDIARMVFYCQEMKLLKRGKENMGNSPQGNFDFSTDKWHYQWHFSGRNTQSFVARFPIPQATLK